MECASSALDSGAVLTLSLPTEIAYWLVALIEWNAMLRAQEEHWRQVDSSEALPVDNSQLALPDGPTAVIAFVADLIYDVRQHEAVKRNKAEGAAYTTLNLTGRPDSVGNLRSNAAAAALDIETYLADSLRSLLPLMLAHVVFLYINRSKALADEWDDRLARETPP